MHSITPDGIDALSMDAKVRFTRLHEPGKPQEGAVLVVMVEGPDLVLGYTLAEVPGLLPIPMLPRVIMNATGASSSGNEGGGHWGWAIPDRPLALTLDLMTHEMLPNGPIPTSGQFGESPSHVHLIPCTMVDGSAPAGLVPGVWYDPAPKASVGSPAIMSGEVSVGRISGLEQEVRPPSPILSTHGDPLGRSLLIRSLGRDATVLAPSSLVGGEPSPIPIRVLRGWLNRVHPRMDEGRLDRIHLALTESIFSQGGSVPQRTTALMREDWGVVEWTRRDRLSRRTQLTGLSPRAVDSLIEYHLVTQDTPLVVDWPFNDRPDMNSLTESIQKVLGFHHPTEPVLHGVGSRIRLDRGARAHLVLVDGRVIEFDLHDRSPIPLPMPPPPGWVVPSSASEVLSWPEVPPASLEDRTSGLDPMDPVARSWMAARIRAAGGDATWADRAEAIDPLSAWIASPSSESARRWLRLGQRLEPAWLELVPPSSMGDVEVIESSETAPRSWRSLACHHLANRLMEKPMQAVAWRHLARGQSPRASVVCGALILAGTWIERSILEEALEWCIETWSNHPVAEVEVLEALQDLDAAGVLRTGIWDQLLPVASRPEATPILASWGSMMVRSPALEPTRYRSIVEHLPARWWSHLAPGILESELAFDLGRRWLELADVPWPALVLRPRGSEVTYPGGSGLHPGITTALRIRLDAFLPREAPPPLLDLRDALLAVEEGRMPTTGRTHPDVGWLAQPLDLWPPSTRWDREGSGAIREALRRRMSGYHHDLSRPAHADLLGDSILE